MRNKHYILLIVFIVFYCTNIFSQNKKQIDSLKTLISSLPDDTLKIQAINELANIYVDIDPEETIEYCKEAFRIAEKKGLPYYQATAANNIGNGYYNLANFKVSLTYYLKALNIQEALGRKRGILSSSGAIGNVYISLGKLDNAIQYFERALKIAYELDNKNAIASCLISIGTIYSDKKDYPKSLDYYFQSLKLFQEVKNEDAIATNYNNIADSYLNLKEYNKSLQYITKAAELYEQTGNIYGQSLALNNIGDYYYSVGNQAKAIEYFKQGLEKGKLIEANEHMLASYKGMAKAYKKLGDYKSALEVHELFQQLNDSIYSIESIKQISEMQEKFDTEKKEREIDLLKKDKKIKEDALYEQSLINRAIVIVGILLLLLTIVLIWAFIQKRKANQILDLKNSKIEIAYNTIGLQHKDIKDSINYAKKIQEAILPPDKFIKENLPNSFVYYAPKDIVSGDFYWVDQIDNKVLFGAVDCTGHGVPGAFMSIVGHNLLEKAINEFKLSQPALILNSLSQGIVKTLHQSENETGLKDGMDIALCSINFNTKKLEYAGAYNPLYIIRNGQLIQINSDKKAIGNYNHEKTDEYTHHEFDLLKGDTIYVFTDGYADQFGGPKGKKFKYKSLQQLLISIHDKDMNEQKTILEETFSNWKGNLEQVDDILIMGVRV
ncbi:MAG: hypothetical protein C0448_14215 [Sphingobacteriaceae bacterium]|nr:hypothetical protein [Sphingobacteriaceae bacterium]